MITHRLSTKKGFSLVEVTLALGIASFCLIALIGLIPLGLQSVSDASEETQAINIATAIIGDIKNTPSNGNTSVSSSLYEIPLPTDNALNIPNNSQYPTLFVDEFGNRTDEALATNHYPNSNVTPSTAGANARYRVAISMRQSSTSQPTRATITLSWPAYAPISQAMGKTTVTTAFTRPQQ